MQDAVLDGARNYPDAATHHGRGYLELGLYDIGVAHRVGSADDLEMGFALSCGLVQDAALLQMRTHPGDVQDGGRSTPAFPNHARTELCKCIVRLVNVVLLRAARCVCL